jgi:hypothetical protein
MALNILYLRVVALPASVTLSQETKCDRKQSRSQWLILQTSKLKWMKIKTKKKECKKQK